MKIFLGILCFAPFVSNAQQQGFVVNGTVTGVKESAKVYLIDANNPADTISGSQVKAGKFSLKGKLTEPGIYTLSISEVNKKTPLFLDNSNITISGNMAGNEKPTVTGSKSHQDFEEFQSTFNPLFSKLNQLTEESRVRGMSDTLLNQSNKLVSEIKERVDNFTRSKKASHVTPLLLVATAQLTDNVQLLETRFASLTPEVRKGYYGRYLQTMLETMKINSIGSMAVDFTQNDTTGKPISLTSFKGKYVLLDFWASWCGPCRQENPNVVNTYNAYKNKNFTVLGVSLDRSRDSWIKAINADGLTWTHVSDLKYWNNEVAQKYKVQSIPQNYLIDPNGKIIARDLRGEALRQRLSELIK